MKTVESKPYWLQTSKDGVHFSDSVGSDDRQSCVDHGMAGLTRGWWLAWRVVRRVDTVLEQARRA